MTWPAVELPDNQGAIDLISLKDKGILFLLDAASKLQGAKEGTFFENVNESHKKNRFYKKPKGARPDTTIPSPRLSLSPCSHTLPSLSLSLACVAGLRMDEGFCVKHYAGDVIYHAGTYASGAEGVTWLDKNNYALAGDQQRCLSTSSLAIIAELFEAPGKEDDNAKEKKKVPQVKSASKGYA